MKYTLIAILVLTLSASGCSAMLDFKDYTNTECGDGLQNPGEDCDDGDMNGQYGFCAADCSGPGSRCGDGVRDVGNEECDGDDFGGQNCGSFGFDPGPLSCDEDCRIDDSACPRPPGCLAVQDLTCATGQIYASTTDTGSRDSMIGYCDSSGVNHTGREMVYRFESPMQQQVEVELINLTVDLDVFIVLDDGSSCLNEICVAASIQPGNSSEHLSFVAMAGEAYFIVVDSYLVPNGNFGLNLHCLQSENCTNGSDDNGNGLADCDDADCVGHIDCVEEANCSDSLDNDDDGLVDCMDPDCVLAGACSCTVARTVTCGDVFPSANYGPGSTDHLTGGWCMDSASTYQGPERVYEFEPPATLPNDVTFHISGLTADVDVFLLQSNAGFCSAESCVFGASSTAGGLADESVTIISVASGVTYFFAVDGWSWAKGEYLVQVLCN